MSIEVTGTAAPHGAFTMGGLTAPPGTLASGELVVAAREGDSGTVIPFSILNGVRPGPVLALIAGTHGADTPRSSRCSGCGRRSPRRGSPAR